MQLIDGIRYNWRGLVMGLTSPRLLLLGAARFVLTLILTAVVAGLVLAYHQPLLAQLWTRPESAWIVWLWQLVSWVLALVMVSVSAVLSYLAAQILFAVFLMDQMSRITEKMVMGRVAEAGPMPFFSQFVFLVKQEIPRAVAPLLLTLVLMLVGWLTPLGPVVAVVASGVAIVFLAWDNSDLVPARRMVPFRDRFAFLLKHLPFHLGFGLWFLIPVMNILFLSFAPVGATLFHLERK